MAIKKPQVSEDTQGKVAYKLHRISPVKKSFCVVYKLLLTDHVSGSQPVSWCIGHQLNNAYQVLAPQYPSASRPLDF